MNSNTIFLVQGSSLAKMRQGAPASEDEMQRLVAQHPDLITGDDEGLLLIRREQRIADSVDGLGRWSLDHLFVTPGAVPVLVELKRASDTRIRREVVGQMLDYAANAVAHWPAGRIADSFTETCLAMNGDPDATLADFIGDRDPEGFWQQVDSNFAEGRIKLVFVADLIPNELARIVEFLNEQMRADVRAVELRWFEGDGGIKTLVPRVIGETQRAAARKATIRDRPSVEQWVAKYIEPLGQAALKGAAVYQEFMAELGVDVTVSEAGGSLLAVTRDDRNKFIYPFGLQRNGSLSIFFRWLRYSPELAVEETRRSYYDHFAKVAGPLSSDNLGGQPGFPVDALAKDGIAPEVKSTMRALVEAARK